MSRKKHISRFEQAQKEQSSQALKYLQKSTVCAWALIAGLAGAAHAQDGHTQAGKAQNKDTQDELARIDLGLASGQVAQEGAGAPAAIDEIQVTGSRIRRSGMATPTPVTMMQASELSTMAPGNMIDALDQVPQFLNNDSPTTAASKADSAGASNLNLRGLGSKRTLVLLDGRRVTPSNRLGNVDINLFPEAVVERVEVVTGGASAAYGTDAVAGVVNFLLDTDFTGVKGHVQGGVTSRGDNENFEVSLAAGTPIGDRMHLVASAEVYQSDRIDNLAGRNWYQGWGLVTNPAWTNSDGAVGPQFLVRRDVVSTAYTNGGLINAPNSAIDRLHFMSDGSATPFIVGDPASVGTGTQSQSIANGGSGFNPSNFDLNVRTPAFPHGTRTGSFIPDVERSSTFLYLDYDATDNLTFFAQGIWGRNKANSVGTLPLGTGSRALTIYQDNAYLPNSINSVMEAEGLESFKLERYHTAADVAQDRFILENNTYSVTLGFDADVANDWTVNGYYQGGWNHNHLDFEGFIRRDRLPLAADAVIDPTTGATVCNVTLQNPGGPYDDCVPIDLFGAGRASQEAIDWVTGDMFVQANTRQHNAEIAASGDVWEGWGAGVVSLAVGASYREQAIKHRLGPEAIVSTEVPVDDPAQGIRGMPTAWAGVDDVLQFVDLEEYQGSFNVKEVFAETLVPLLSGRTMVQQLNLSLAARYADYTGSGGIWAWKGGLDWQVTNELRLRGTLSRDIRAGSLEERFDRQGQGAAVEDPELNDRNYTTFQIRGGNPQINPEKADTVTIGAVYQPTYLDGLSLSLDWFSVEIKDAIDLLDVQTIVDSCYDTGNPEFCNRIIRDSATGLITRVENTFINVNQQKTSGVDLEAVYNSQVKLFGGGAESLSLRFLGSWLDESSITLFGASKVNYVGQLGLDFPGFAFPEYRATANVTYGNGPFTLFVQERYVDGGVIDVDWVDGVDIADNSVSSAFYTDLRLSVDVEAAHGGLWQVFFNVTNLFDKDPPLIPSWSSFTGTGYGANLRIHDVLGRRFTAGVSFQY